MTYKETLEMLKNLHSLYVEGGDDSVFSSIQKTWISKTYKQETGKAIRDCSCKNKYTDAVDELLFMLKAKGTTVEEESYTLKEGFVIWLNNDCYSRRNLTQEVAKKWLELHPDGKNLFEKIAE